MRSAVSHHDKEEEEEEEEVSRSVRPTPATTSFPPSSPSGSSANGAASVLPFPRSVHTEEVGEGEDGGGGSARCPTRGEDRRPSSGVGNATVPKGSVGSFILAGVGRLLACMAASSASRAEAGLHHGRGRDTAAPPPPLLTSLLGLFSFAPGIETEIAAPFFTPWGRSSDGRSGKAKGG